MQLEYFGANCLRITAQKTKVIIDDNLSQLGLKSITGDKDISIYTNEELQDDSVVTKSAFCINTPGEYEIQNISVQGVAARSHMSEDEKDLSSIIYKLIINDLRLVVVGHVHPSLSDTQLEAIGKADILCVPIGNNGYTLDATGAAQIIRQIEPKVVIPTHYSDKAVKYKVAQKPLDEAQKGLSLEVSDTLDAYKPKALETVENTRLIVLNRQSK